MKPNWYERFQDRASAATDAEHYRIAAERHGRHLAHGAIFDGITKLMDERPNTTADEKRIFLDCREVVLAEMRKLSAERALAADMALCRINHAKEEDA